MEKTVWVEKCDIALRYLKMTAKTMAFYNDTSVPIAWYVKLVWEFYL
jgi:hypothetical protein